MKKINLSKAELRQQAEAKLKARKKKKTTAPTTDADILRVVHELEVHQIELEMQNEELVQSHAELEAALSQYTDLYNLSPVGYFTLSRNGTISQVNRAGANLLGMEPGQLIRRRLGLFVSIESRPTFSNYLDKVFTSGVNETCEIALLKDETHPLWVYIEAISSGVQNRVCSAVISDTTVRKQAEEELRHLSSHDVLTGLYNRGFFMAEMERLERGRQFPVSIVMADLDDLKYTNDHYGHAAGDARLKGVAQVLTTAFRTEDVVARIGGDEFAVLLPNTDTASAKILLGRVQQVIQENNSIHAEIPIQLSIGVSTAEDPIPLSVTLKKADVNMYREKQGNDDT
jgi:diguanylate cyclase (GGDEF)-like protein/PAS domain S-box-containing protein